MSLGVPKSSMIGESTLSALQVLDNAPQSTLKDGHDMRYPVFQFRFLLAALLCLAPTSRAEVNNLKIVTDASPDYSDMDSLIHSTTGKWQTPEEKLWAMFRWNQIARRQTMPMSLHGTALTDPIRQFNDYGFTMCSTISGINCSIWDAMGFPVKYWDVTNHTVAEVFYNNRWHMYDNSLSQLYTLCDGQTIAGVEDIGATRGCAASGGKKERGHIALYHALYATSPNGYITGSDTIRTLEDEVGVFNPNGLKYRSYYNDGDRGHRAILNLRPGETYTRHYKSLGNTKAHFVANNGKDPEDDRFKIRGNGVRTFTPALTTAMLPKIAHSLTNIKTTAPSGIEPQKTGQAGEAVFKIESSNVLTNLKITALVARKSAADTNAISISTTNGLSWQEVWKNDGLGQAPVALNLVDEVTGAYEVLVKVTLLGKAATTDAQLKSIKFEATTMLNSKTQARLNIGRNTVYIGAGEQTGSIVLWPDLRGDNAKPLVVAQQNVVFEKGNPGYQGTLHAAKANEEAFVVFRIDAPRDITRLIYGGRLYNRAPNAHIDYLHSFDDGKTWIKSYSLTDIQQPWDIIRYETIDKIPAGTRSVLMKYVMNASEAGSNACSIYALRMEANHKPIDSTFQPLEVTFNWSERQTDYSLVERSHTELVTKLPHKYFVNVGGEDLPRMNSLRVGVRGATPGAKIGYSDGRDAGGEIWKPKWATYGRNLAQGKTYTLSIPSDTNWEAGDPDGKKLTDGIVGPTYSGGTSYRSGALWGPKKNPVITLDLGEVKRAASFGLNFHGYEGWNALAGEVKDRVEVLISKDGKDYSSIGYLHTALRFKDVPANFMLPDTEALNGATFRLIPDAPIETRFVRLEVSSPRHFAATEIEVLDAIRFEPFDLRIALPDEKLPNSGVVPTVLTKTGRPVPINQAAKNQSKPIAEPVAEVPTLRSLGTYWIIGGDANADAQVDVQYRTQGSTAWKDGPPLFRVERDAHKDEKKQSDITVPDDAWLFAGSVVLLEPDTAYEIKLSLHDPDGGQFEKSLTMRTRAEPTIAANAPRFYVVPGTGGGAGTADNPYRGVASAQAKAKAGDVFLLRPGVYGSTFTVTKSGEAGRPIVWSNAGGGEAVIDGQDNAGKRAERSISATGVHDVWFEGLTIRNANYGIVAHESARIVVRRCHLRDVDYGIAATRNETGQLRDFTIADNVLEGPSTWPRTKGIEDARGVQISGEGHAVCFNRIRGFADAIDTFPSPRCASIDFYNNDVSELTDDGIEMDYSQRNTRCFFNRITNVFQGVSVQPIFGGPVYVFRNALYNVVAAPFKMHNSPSGALMLHNTVVKQGMPLEIMTSAPVRNCVYRNNLFIGTQAGFAYETTAPMQNCDFDYDGFGGGPWEKFLKWNGVRYNSLDEVRKQAPVYRHAIQVDARTTFASDAQPPTDSTKVLSPPDLRLKAGSAAIDAGEVRVGFSEGYTGAAPDLGAYEVGSTPPHYGPRVLPTSTSSVAAPDSTVR